MLDLTLAVAHHLLVFSLFGVLAAEWLTVRPGISAAAIRRVASVDLAYGILAALILVVGFARVFLAAKGWSYYQHNAFFWAKLAAFVAVGCLSVPPTLAYIRWRRAADAPSDVEVLVARRFLNLQMALFALIPVFAAAMARGYGEF